MVVVAGSIKLKEGLHPEVLACRTVMVVDRDFGDRRAWTVDLEKAGFGLILTAGDLETARTYGRQNGCDLVFVDPHAGATLEEGFEFMQSLRLRHPKGLVAVLTGNPSLALCFRAARSGVNDFLVKGPHLSIAEEAVRMLRISCAPKGSAFTKEGNFATGLFSSVGVTRGELAVLTEFSRGYPKQQDIARRLEIDEVSVRKVFSRVYKKLENYFPVNNQAQLSHIMTICSLFD